MLWHDNRPREAPVYAASDLKLCDLCGALNLNSNRECFVCRWHGRFEHRPDVVSMAMELLERKHGRLEVCLLSSSLVSSVPLQSRFVFRMKALYLTLRNWFLR